MNWLAIVLSAVILFIIGSVWYSPVLFGKQWAGYLGREVPSGAPPPQAIITALAGSLVTATILAYLISLSAAPTLGLGLFMGGAVWLGFSLPPSAIMGSFEDRPFGQVAINLGQSLVSYLVIGALLGLWH
ncbi:MAG: DUF1761 domain-containing protein [Candidatus Dormibacteria bacterium]